MGLLVICLAVEATGWIYFKRHTLAYIAQTFRLGLNHPSWLSTTLVMKSSAITSHQPALTTFTQHLYQSLLRKLRRLSRKDKTNSPLKKKKKY